MTDVDLFLRKIEMRIGDTRIDGLNIEFTSRRSIRKEPNTLSASVTGLSMESVEQFQRASGEPVQLFAGYKTTGTHEIFAGELRRAWGTKADGSTILAIEADDGRNATKSRFFRSYTRGAALSTIIEDLCATMGVGIGNALDALGATEEGAPAKQMAAGYAVTGRASEVLDSILNGLGWRYSIQSGMVQAVPATGSLEQEIVELTPSSGMVGSPSIDKDGTITVAALMIPGVKPGKRISVKSRLFTGTFIASVCEYRGTLGSGSFGVTMQGKVLA